MADDRRGSLLFSPRFLLLCLYVMCYLTVRAYGEIVYLGVDSRFGSRFVSNHIVEPSNHIPRWRRQVYRVVFSPLMVVEEEGRRLKDKGTGLVEEAGDYGRSYLPD